MRRHLQQGRSSNRDVRRSTAGDPHQRQRDRGRRRRRLLSHLQFGHLDHERRGRGEVNQTARRDDTPQRTHRLLAHTSRTFFLLGPGYENAP